MARNVSKSNFWLVAPCIWLMVGYPVMLSWTPDTIIATEGAINHIMGLTPGMLIILFGQIWKKSFKNYVAGRVVLGVYLFALSWWVFFYFVADLSW